jgi:hypothetical protein
MATALNVFKTVTADLTTQDTLLYTAPRTKTSIFLSIQATNISNSTVLISFYHNSVANVKTALAKNFKVPVGDALSIINPGSKLVLETGQSVISSVSANNSVQVVMGVLESAND